MSSLLESIDLPRPVTLPELRYRHYRGEPDLAALVEVTTASRRADSVDWMTTVDDLRLELANTVNEDPFESLIVAELGDRVVAFARARWSIRDGTYVYDTEGEVHPDVRRQGIGRILLHAEQALLQATGGGHLADAPKRYQSWVEEGQTGARALLADEGYTPLRYFAEMGRDLAEPIPGPELPDGVELRPVRSEDRRRVFDAEAEAFQDHWGSRAWTDADFELTVSSPHLDAGLWRVAWDGDEVAGAVVTFVFPEENALLGLNRGWLERVSVRRPWRRRGVARALIVSAMEGLRERGIAQAVLGVDAANPTGAFQLYEGLGFRVLKRAEAVARPFDAPASG